MTASPGRLLAILVAIGALAPHAWAAPKGDKRDKADKEDRNDASDEGGDDDESAKPARPARKDAGDSADDGGEFKKQDLSGHDQRSTRKENVFERDRFFVDKTDSSKTARGTLVQGSITSTTFGYHESGAPLAAPDPETNPVPSASQFDRLFTDLRLQTDFRHISGGKWEARVDTRARLVNDPPRGDTATVDANRKVMEPYAKKYRIGRIEGFHHYLFTQDSIKVVGSAWMRYIESGYFD